MNGTAFDFGYEWTFTHIHLVPAFAFGILAVLAWKLGWKRWITAIAAAISVWGFAAFALVNWFIFEPNRPMKLPIAKFLAEGKGRVLDVGSGSGRATAGLLLARPGATAVGLDKFAAGYGISGNTPERFTANMRAAGVDSRASIEESDMRKMPFPNASFDAAISAYAIDHINREGVQQTFAELRRVIRPGGEFLYMMINRDRYIAFTYPFLHGHGYFGQMPAHELWRGRLTSAGFEILEQGTAPGMLYFWCRNGPTTVANRQ